MLHWLCFSQTRLLAHRQEWIHEPFASPSFHIRKGTIEIASTSMLRITVAKMIAGSESNKHYLLVTYR
jgi:hypothetical protein